MKENKALLQKHKLTYLLPAGLALGLLAQWLFIGRPLGISWFIFTAALLAALIVTGRRAGLQAVRGNLWLWPALFFFAAMVFLRANPFLTFLNIVATLGLLAFVFYFYAAGTAADLPLSGILVQPWRMAGQTLIHAVSTVTAGIEPLSANNNRGQELAPVLRGGMLALPVMVLFTLLLSSADLVFSAHLQRLLGIDFTVIAPHIGRGLFAGLVALFAAGATATAVLRGLRQPQDDESWVEQMARTLPLRISLGSAETTTILVLISGLFLVFVLLQVKYLFGGAANITRAGFTYADYARRGFFELVLVASLSLALILLLNWLTRRESKRQIKWHNAFSSLLIGLVLLLLFAAFWRMRLYQQAYGYTELRLIVLLFEIWLGLLLLWFLVTLWRKPEHFAIGFMVAALGFIASLNLVNPDVFIVRQNMQRYRVTGDLDMAYLTHLSDDAVPLLVAAAAEVENDEQLRYRPWCEEEQCTQTLGEIVGENLHGRYEFRKKDQRWLDWPAYHRARYRANLALTGFNNQ